MDMVSLDLRPSRSHAAAMTFVGNATTVLELGGCTILTDPAFLHAGDHVHVGYGVTTRRRLEPALAPHELPPLDAVLLSHLHGDHWDEPAERALARDLPIVTTASAARTLAGRGFTRTIGLARWDRVALRGDGARLVVGAVPARHGPPAIASLLPQTNGYILDALTAENRPFRVYVSGDTMPIAALREIPRRYPEIDVALVHLGGTRIPHRRFGVLVTMDAARGVKAVRMLDPRTVVPIHTDDYDLFSSSLDDFTRAMRTAGLADRLRVVERGERALL